MSSQPKIARVVTIPLAFVHFKSFLALLKKKGADIHLISSAGEYEKVLKSELDLSVTKIEIAREINIFKDLAALLKLIIYFRKNKFDIIHSSTPKAGLLCAIAGVFLPSTVCIHTFTGQRWATSKGILRWLLMNIDKLIIKLNSKCYADSPSQIKFLVGSGVANEGEVLCLHKGSYGGIDCKRFNNAKFPEARKNILSELKLNDDSILLLYVGRLTHEKGVDDLVKAFTQATPKNDKLKLILIGPYEQSLDSLDEATLNEIKNNKSIFSLGFKNQPEHYFSGCDIFCLPSYREGFGTVVLEAAACGLPTIGTRIPGLVDSIVENETGLLVPLKNTEKLADAILSLSENEGSRKKMGAAAKLRAQKDFSSELLSEIQWDEYQILLKNKI